MNQRYGDALEVLQSLVSNACRHMAYFHILLGMVAKQVSGKQQLACQATRMLLKLNQIDMMLSTT